MTLTSGPLAGNVENLTLVDFDFAAARRVPSASAEFRAQERNQRALRLRIGGLLRRSWRRPGTGVVRIGELVVDPSRRSVTVRERPVVLTQKEYALLLALVREPTSVRTKQELLRSVWGYRTTGVTRTIDSHACRLRRKLGVYGDEFIVNVWGVGYRLVDADPSIDLDTPAVEATSPEEDGVLSVDVEPPALGAESCGTDVEPPVVGVERASGDADPETETETETEAGAAAEIVVDGHDGGAETRAIARAASLTLPVRRSALGAGGVLALLPGSGEVGS